MTRMLTYEKHATFIDQNGENDENDKNADADDDDDDEEGFCRNCEGGGPLGHFCTFCEDSGMIYGLLSGCGYHCRNLRE